jgi:hypothetical protein
MGFDVSASLVESPSHDPVDGRRTMRRIMKLAVLISALAACAILAGAALARPAATPQNLTPPTVGDPFVQGTPITAGNGTWAYVPTSYAYQWQRCDTDGTDCDDIAGATSQTYTPVAADVTHTLTVTVTGSNTDGKNSAVSDPSGIVSSTGGPTNTGPPTIAGTAKVGQTLTLSNGLWSATPATATYQWQRCARDGSNCLNVPGATKQTYVLGSDDIDHTIRGLVTVKTAGGDIATTFSNTTGQIPFGTAPTTTTTATTTTAAAAPAPPVKAAAGGGHKAPTVSFVSLRRSGARVSARYRVCTSSPGVLTITAHDAKKKAKADSHRFAVHATACGSFASDWPLAKSLLGPGKLVITLQATDPTGAASKLASRTLTLH